MSGGVIGGGVALQGRYNLGGGQGKQPLKLGQNRRRAIGHFRETTGFVALLQPYRPPFLLAFKRTKKD